MTQGLTLASGIPYGFKRAHVFLYESQTTPNVPTKAFVVEGTTGEGASQTLTLEGLAKEPTTVAGSNIIYYQARKGVAQPSGTLKLLDVPFEHEQAMLGRHVTEEGIAIIGANTEAPEAAVIAESETISGDKIYIMLGRGVFRRDGMEIATVDPNEDFTPDGVEYSFKLQAMRTDDAEFEGAYVGVVLGEGAGSEKMFELLGANETFVDVTGVTVTPATTSVAAGSTRQITATVQPSTASNQDVRWESADTAIATVTAGGLITGITAGTTTVTVRTVEGNKTATVNVTVTAAV